MAKIISAISRKFNRETQLPVTASWKGYQLFLFRILFLFTIPFIIPLDLDWYRDFWESRSFFWYLSSLTGHRPNFLRIETESGRWGIASYATWGLILAISVAGAVIWTFIDKYRKVTNYDKLYYWTQVAIRYRLALGLIAFGFLKVYPMQMPYPALSNLITDFGDYNSYKIYWQHVGLSTWYQVLLGWVEVIGGILLFFRPTVFLGAFINAGVLFNISHANFAYEGGVHVYSSFFVLFSLILLVPYLVLLWRLFIQERAVKLTLYKPEWTSRIGKFAYFGIKGSFIILFTFVYGALRYEVHYVEGYLKDPITPGLPQSAGIYHVSQFFHNGTEIPYNPTDSVRWHDAIFEKWSTLSYKVAKPYPISLANGTPNEKDIYRSYELAGIAGGRRFLYYEIDSVNSQLLLWDKNIPRTGGDGSRRGRRPNRNKGDQVKKDEKAPPLLIWKYTRQGDDRIILEGKDENKADIKVVLDRNDRSFAIKG